MGSGVKVHLKLLKHNSYDIWVLVWLKGKKNKFQLFSWWTLNMQKTIFSVNNVKYTIYSQNGDEIMPIYELDQFMYFKEWFFFVSCRQWKIEEKKFIIDGHQIRDRSEIMTGGGPGENTPILRNSSRAPPHRAEMFDGPPLPIFKCTKGPPPPRRTINTVLQQNFL